MFLNLLNEPQKRAFAALATKIVIADNTVHHEEFSLMNILHAEMGWDLKADGNDLIEVDKMVYKAFDSKRSRIVALMELYVVALCENKLPPEELAVLDEVRRAFGFSEAEAEALLDWARDITPRVLAGWKMAWDENISS